MSETWKQHMKRMQHKYGHLPNYITNVNKSEDKDVSEAPDIDPPTEEEVAKARRQSAQALAGEEPEA